MRVAATPAFGVDLLPAAVASYLAGHEDTVFEIETLHHDEISTALLESRIDIGLALDSVAVPGLTSETLARGEFVVIAPPDLDLGSGKSVTIDALKDAARIEQLMAVARQAAPEVADFGHPETHPWAGNRSLTPDGRPLVGPTQLKGLYLNTGHGSLGWTLACACAEELVEAVAPYAHSYRNDRTAMAVTAAEPTKSVST